MERTRNSSNGLRQHAQWETKTVIKGGGGIDHDREQNKSVVEIGIDHKGAEDGHRRGEVGEGLGLHSEHRGTTHGANFTSSDRVDLKLE